jgi:hypothetical protein
MPYKPAADPVIVRGFTILLFPDRPQVQAEMEARNEHRPSPGSQLLCPPIVPAKWLSTAHEALLRHLVFKFQIVGRATGTANVTDMARY